MTRCPPCPPKVHRRRELDFLRGLAVLMMILFHLSFDLQHYYGWNVPAPAWFACTTASLFLFVLGICFTISWERKPQYHRSLRRGLFIFGGGLLVSLATWMINPELFVKFGILHLIGVSALIQPFFASLRGWNLLLGCVVIIIGIFLHTMYSALTTYHLSLTTFLFPLGIINNTFTSLDYYPLFPWFGVILLGMGIGSLLYVPKRAHWIRRLDTIRYPRWILWMGRKALWIYFAHQPVIMAFLALLFKPKS